MVLGSKLGYTCGYYAGVRSGLYNPVEVEAATKGAEIAMREANELKVQIFAEASYQSMKQVAEENEKVEESITAGQRLLVVADSLRVTRSKSKLNFKMTKEKKPYGFRRY
ncbi:unnamed protein product [Ilex paraguariensis]|uniref:RNase H type-1 domain-containing protein n=1 Tax=Ilex paraguariensis TaxID=185542 RepID=A0ABC8R3X4_9AQUA